MIRCHRPAGVPSPATDRERAGRRLLHAETGAVGRGLLWVVAGLLTAVTLFAAVSPELLRGAPAQTAGLAGVVLLAGVPGVVLLGFAALRRRRLGDDQDGKL